MMFLQFIVNRKNMNLNGIMGPILMTENPVCVKGSKSVNFLIAQVLLQVLLLELTVLAGALC